MLNRRISNYIFYLIIIAIIGVVYLVRSLMLGGLLEKIDTLDNNNISLQAEIDNLKDIVQTNKDVQEDDLYELFNQVPQKYSSTELTYLAISKLELVGIDESLDYGRSIILNSKVSFSNDSILSELVQQFDVVEVQVQFDIEDTSVISNLIDVLNDSDHVFLVNYVDFHTTEDESFINVTIHFLSFYEKEDLS